jgi:hypothetical protein
MALMHADYWPLALSGQIQDLYGMMLHGLIVAGWLIAGCIAGCLLMFAIQRPRVTAQLRALQTLRAQLDAAGAAQIHLADLRAQVSSLRHDLRGILSPALLTADRLVGSDDPGIRKAGDVVVRTVERATARLAESKLGQDETASPRV